MSRPEKRSLLWAGEVARLLLGFSTLALLARSAGAEVLGTYLSVIAVLLLLPRLLDCGLPHALGYFLRVNPKGLRAGSLLIARHIALATPMAILLAYGLRYFPFANESATALVQEHWLILTLLILSELALLLGLASFIPTARFKAYLGTIVLPPLLFFAVLVYWLRTSPGTAPEPAQLLGLLLVASLTGVALMTAGLTRAGLQGAQSPFPVRSAYHFGFRSHGAAVAKIAAQRFDRLFLAAVLGAAGYAQYSLAISVRDMATFPANLYAMTLRNRQIDLIVRHQDLTAARSVLRRVSFTWLALALTGALVLFPLWPIIVRLAFGPAYAATSQFVQIVAFSCAPLAIMGFAWNHLFALNLPGRVTVLTSVSLAMAIPTFLLFIHLSGPTKGVAIAVVVWSVATAAASLGWALASKQAQPPRTIPS